MKTEPTVRKKEEHFDENGRYHNDNGPAIIFYGESGILKEFWYKNGAMHRDDDGPAFINNVNGTLKWYKNGILHREGNKPTVIYSNGTKKWHEFGNLKKVIYPDGKEETY